MVNKVFVACVAAGVLAAAGGGGIAYSASGSADDLQREVAENAKEIDSLKKELKKAGVTVTEAEVELNAANASKAGLAVCEVQNSMVLEEHSDEDHTEQINSLKKYFGDAKLQIPWYIGKGTPKWTFETIYDSSVDRIPVLWLCRNDEGQLLAYVRAVYHAGSDSFSDGVVSRTAIGDSLIPSDGEAPVIKQESPMDTDVNPETGEPGGAVDPGQVSGVADDVIDPDDQGQEIPEDDMLGEDPDDPEESGDSAAQNQASGFTVTAGTEGGEQ